MSKNTLHLPESIISTVKRGISEAWTGKMVYGATMKGNHLLDVAKDLRLGQSFTLKYEISVDMKPELQYNG